MPRLARPRQRPAALLVFAATAALLLPATVVLTGCGATAAGTVGGGVRVVAAENFWGSIARQIGGAHADVESIIVNPAQDPHCLRADDRRRADDGHRPAGDRQRHRL